jgi:hypothetical protein
MPCVSYSNHTSSVELYRLIYNRMPCTEPELLTPADVATILSLKAGTLAVWRRKNQGPPWLHIGSRVFYPARELHRWLHAQPHGGEPAQFAPEISATVLAANVKINRSRLSNIERGYIQPTDEELQRLKTALDDLIKAKSVVDRVAASVGWPFGVHHDH